MNQTEYLNLNKPGYDNLADIGVLNENFEKIDKNAQQVAINLEDHLKVKSTQEKDGHMSKEDKKKIDGIAPGANNYTHPNTPSIRHVSDEEKSDWNNKEPGIIKKNAFNKDFGTTADSVLEGAKLAELLGCDYGGILNNSNLKTKGLAYYCTANKSLYRCKKDTDLNYANLDYFEGYSHSDFASKLENFTVNTLSNFGDQKFYGGLSFRWGMTSCEPKSTSLIEFNKPFEKGCLGILLTVRDNIPGITNSTGSYHNPTASYFRLVNNYQASGLTFFWFAIGY